MFRVVGEPAVGAAPFFTPVNASFTPLADEDALPPTPASAPTPNGLVVALAVSLPSAVRDSAPAVTVVFSPTYACVVCVIAAVAVTPETATSPSEPAWFVVVDVEIEVASMFTVPPKLSEVVATGVVPARVPTKASVVRSIVAADRPIAAPAPRPKPMLVTVAVAVCVPSAFTWSVLAVTDVVPPLMNARVAPPIVDWPFDTATPTAVPTASPLLTTGAVRVDFPCTSTSCPSAVRVEPATYACVVLWRFAVASEPAPAMPTTAIATATAYAAVSGVCVAVASTMMFPFDAVTVAPETNALTVLFISLSTYETPAENPRNPADTATPTTVAWIDDVSSAFTVTDVPAVIVPPVTEASTLTVVVLVPTAAAPATAADETEIAAAIAAAAGFETISELSVVFTSTSPAVAVTSAFTVAARTVFSSVFSATAAASDAATAPPRPNATDTAAAVAFAWIELSSTAVTWTSVPPDTPLPWLTSVFATTAVATPCRWLVVTAPPAATAPPKARPTPTATPTPTASTVIDGFVSTATVRLVP